MDIFQSILLILILSTTNAQWYIKKNYRTQPVSYPNPGKRSLPEQESNFINVDCSIPYSQLYSYQQKIAWIFTCNYATSSSNMNENPLSTNSNNINAEVLSTSQHILQNKRSLHVVPPYFKELDNSFNKFSMKLLRRVMKRT